jgi:hypothetical protein
MLQGHIKGLCISTLKEIKSAAIRGVKRAKRERNRDIAFHVSFVSRKKKKFAFHVPFERNVTKFFIFVKIILERKKFRLRSTFCCSNVTKKCCVSCFVRAKRDVEMLKRWNFDTLAAMFVFMGWTHVGCHITWECGTVVCGISKI